MEPRDIVALMLTVGIIILMLSATYFRCLWMDCEVNFPDFQERVSFWKDVVNIILGGLIGYIGGRSANDKS